MVFPPFTVLDEAEVFELADLGERPLVEGKHFAGEFGNGDAADTGGGSFHPQLQQIAANADRLENLRPLVTRQARNPHLRENLQQSRFRGFAVVGDRFA